MICLCYKILMINSLLSQKNSTENADKKDMTTFYYKIN